MNCVKSFSFTRHGATHPERRLNIVAKSSGGFGIVEQYFYRNLDEEGFLIAEGWVSLRPDGGIYADAQIAEREVLEILRVAAKDS